MAGDNMIPAYQSDFILVNCFEQHCGEKAVQKHCEPWRAVLSSEHIAGCDTLSSIQSSMVVNVLRG